MFFSFQILLFQLYYVFERFMSRLLVTNLPHILVMRYLHRLAFSLCLFDQYPYDRLIVFLFFFMIFTFSLSK
jgi:hypothetical protein